MTEAQQKSLKILKREIDGLGPRQSWFDRELEIINAQMHAAHAGIVERREPLRVLLPKWEAVKKRFDHYGVEFAKFSRKIDTLRARFDGIEKTDVPVETVTAFNKAFTALLDGSHRLRALVVEQEELAQPREGHHSE